MNYNQTLKHLYSLTKFEKLGLQRTRNLLKKLDNPEKQLKIIHVAGTNGKGSVCAMLSSILKEAEFKVGLFTSPHLTRFTERMKINDKEISKKDVVKYFNIVNKKFNKQSFFEFITAMALKYFYDKKVDYVILEVGLGGRLDATNVVIPEISVITNIGLDHVGILGNTKKAIAYEKAGIIKKNKPVVTGAKGQALQEIRKIAKKRNSKLVLVKNLNYKTNLLGEHQKDNANIAAAVAKELRINDSRIRKGLKKVNWPGRLQFISKKVLVDVAHNLQGVEVLINYVKKLRKKIILVFGCSVDKDYKKMLKMLMPLADPVILTRANIYHKAEKAMPTSILIEEIKKYRKAFFVNQDVKKAVEQAKKIARKNDLILVTGSIFVVGEIVK